MNTEPIDRISSNVSGIIKQSNSTLRHMCHVNENSDTDNFVGIRADTNGMDIHFPLGYELPNNDDDLRIDVLNLIGVLSTFLQEDSRREDPNLNDSISVNFPMHAYIQVIRNFLNTGHYYTETEAQYISSTRGIPHWPRTLKNQRGLIQKNGSIVFTQTTVRKQTPNTNKKITQIHQYCVHEAFSKMGQIYVSFVPEKPSWHPSVTESISILTDKISHTYNDVDRNLFQAMRRILLYKDSQNENQSIFFGTNRFEYVWQSMIDVAFGIASKDQFFPKANWLLDYGSSSKRKRTSLQPDAIMIYGDKFYVLDAKYYRYGWTGNPEHLPGGPDINKQITYGEYIARSRSIPNERLFNAFIIPYNKKNNYFGLKEDIENIGEAIGNWRFDIANPHMHNYERVQGIVIDTRYLMYNYIGTPTEQKCILAECIERVLSRENITDTKLR